MTTNYVITNGELYHYGVAGMKWGVRKAQNYDKMSRFSRSSARMLSDRGRKKVAKLLKGGQTEKAKAVENKYQRKVENAMNRSERYQNKSKEQNRKVDFRVKRENTSYARSKGAKRVTNILAGPFANRTYNSVIAAGGTKTGARVVTALTSAGGPLAHVAVSSLYTRQYAKGRTMQ